MICFDGRVRAPVSSADGSARVSAGVSAVGRAVAALLLAGSTVVLAQVPTQAAAPTRAAACPNVQVADQARRADDVFTGTVTGRSVARRSGTTTTTYDVDVERVYKGPVRDSSVQVSSRASKGAPALAGLVKGSRYVFFTSEQGTTLATDRCSGTARAGDSLVGQVEKLLGNGHLPVPPAPQKASFTKVADAAPTSFTRLAAPGAAMVLVGLLGLVVVRRLARRA